MRVLGCFYVFTALYNSHRSGRRRPGLLVSARPRICYEFTVALITVTVRLIMTVLCVLNRRAPLN